MFEKKSFLRSFLDAVKGPRLNVSGFLVQGEDESGIVGLIGRRGWIWAIVGESF